MTTTPRPPAPTPLQPMQRRRFGLLLPLGGMALLAACSKDPEPAAPAPADPLPATPTLPTPNDAAAGTSPTASAPSSDSVANSANLPMVDPADPAAVALAYTADATQVDATRQPKYQPGQACSNCALYAGQPGSAAGPCPLFAGRQVSAKAWCSTYAKKAG